MRCKSLEESISLRHFICILHPLLPRSAGHNLAIGMGFIFRN
jgi:hypothetical protein